jgi:hypothetical protein
LERHVRILKNRSDCDRELFAASTALQQTIASGILGIMARRDAGSIADFAAVPSQE